MSPSLLHHLCGCKFSLMRVFFFFLFFKHVGRVSFLLTAFMDTTAPHLEALSLKGARWKVHFHTLGWQALHFLAAQEHNACLIGKLV